MSTTDTGFTSFEQLGSLDEEEFEGALSLFAPRESNQLIDLWSTKTKRRRRLLRPSLQIAKLEADGRFVLPTLGTEENALHNIDISLSRCHIAESLSDSFDAQVQIGVEHEFEGGEKAQILHTRTVQQDLPIFNVTQTTSALRPAPIL